MFLTLFCSGIFSKRKKKFAIHIAYVYILPEKKLIILTAACAYISINTASLATMMHLVMLAGTGKRTIPG